MQIPAHMRAPGSVLANYGARKPWLRSVVARGLRGQQTQKTESKEYTMTT